MRAPRGQICGVIVNPWLQVFCNGPLYCGGPSRSQSTWNPQRGSAKAVAAETIPPHASTPWQRPTEFSML